MHRESGFADFILWVFYLFTSCTAALAIISIININPVLLKAQPVFHGITLISITSPFKSSSSISLCVILSLPSVFFSMFLLYTVYFSLFPLIHYSFPLYSLFLSLLISLSFSHSISCGDIMSVCEREDIVGGYLWDYTTWDFIIKLKFFTRSYY